MDKVANFFGVVLVAFLAVFFLIILGTLMGAVCGWVVGLFFGNEILGILSQLGIHGYSMFEIGAFFGFIGAFFRTPAK